MSCRRAPPADRSPIDRRVRAPFTRANAQVKQRDPILFETNAPPKTISVFWGALTGLPKDDDTVIGRHGTDFVHAKAI